jgi:hypothetical protein
MPPKAEQISHRFKQRGKDKQYFTDDQKRAMSRVGDLSRIYRHQYPNGLPHNDLGVKYARYMCRTLAFFESVEHRERWLDRYTPWMDADIRAELAGMSAYRYSDKSLGQHLELYDEDRERLRTWTVEAVDVSKGQRAAINAEKKLKAKERHRRKKGIKPRDEYLASVKSPEPWKALSMSRARYYRLGLNRETGSGIAFSYINTSPSLTVPNTTAAAPSDEGANVVQFPRRPSQATNQTAAGKNMLTWRPMLSCNGLYADTHGFGRFAIRTGDFIVLKHNGEVMRRFGSQEEAMTYAQDAYMSMLLHANDDYQEMAMAA